MDLGLATNGGIVENILDHKVPGRLKYRIIANNIVDRIIGGEGKPGLKPGGAILFTGRSGGGKTTLAQQYLDDLYGLYKGYNGFIGFGAKVFFNSTEQTVMDAAERVQSISDIQHGFPFGNFTVVDDLIAAFNNYFTKPVGDDAYSENDFVLVIDSLPGMKLSKDDDSTNSLELKVLEKLVSWAKENYICLIILQHVTKNGTAAGSNKLIHFIDAHMHIDYILETKTVKRFYIEMLKNRMGPVNIKYFYQATANNGLVFEKEED